MSSIIFIASLLMALTAAQDISKEPCAVNRCHNTERCYNRNAVGQPSFVCECAQPKRMGHDCTTKSDNNVITTSYGLNSGVDVFESENYPNPYGHRNTALYLLYIPGVTQIHFSFDSPFGVEDNKDELYVGAGLEFAFDQINGRSSKSNPIDKYFFDGRSVPQSFTIFSDTAWVYFLTDKNNDDQIFPGWRLRWTSTSPSPSPDIIAPIVTRVDDIIKQIPLGQGETTVSWTDPTATDNSGSVTLTSRTHSPGSSFPVGTTTVTYTFTDAADNSASTSFNVIVSELDTTPPVISSINDVTVTVVSGLANVAHVSWTEPSATDNSGTATLISRTNSPNSYFTVGTTPVTYTFGDPSGNTASVTFNVNVVEVDGTAPVITPMNDITVDVPLGTPGKTVSWVEPSATDDSNTAILTSRTFAPNSFFPVGTTPVTYIFTDSSGNAASMTFNVNVVEVDDTTPVISCIEDVSETIGINIGGAAVYWTEPTATDDSRVVNWSSRSRAPGSFFAVGTEDVSYTFVDSSGNSATCIFKVSVIEVDHVAPVVECIEDVSETVAFNVGGATVTWIEPSARDESGIVNLSSKSRSPGSFFPVGSTPVTYTYVDVSGNTATCTFTVNVIEVDTDAPVVVCPNDIVLTVLTGVGGTSFEFNLPTAEDDSGTVNLVSGSHQPGAFFSIGITTVTYRYADASGNVGSCSFTITVQDANPCFDDPCKNGGTCVIETLTSYSCLCQDCYNGQNCEVATNTCAGNQCSNGAACVQVTGSCTQYQCQCTDCYFGQYCRQRVNPCDNHQCRNGAQCQPDANDCAVYYCQCQSCYLDQFCETQFDVCAITGCLNGGQCVSTLNGACTEYTCSCGGCFTGELCELERDPCANNPCGNNGVCSKVVGSCTAYICECRGCYSGYNCELTISSPCLRNPCQNDGRCNGIAGQCAAYSCTCTLGFAGINCDLLATTNINQCNSFPCVNGGSCLTMDSTYYICMCPDGYVGINCQTLEGSPPFFDACTNSQCANGATCYNSFNSNNVINEIFTRQYSCVCAAGFSGTNCALSSDANPSLDICGTANRANCDNAGVCYNAYHSYDGDVNYFCNCPEGFIGHNCETIYSDPCGSNPCLNGAQCSSLGTYFTCQCANGYTSTYCNIDTGADNIPPVISNIPSSLYYSTTNDGYSATWTEPTASDNSGTVNLARRSHVPGAFFPLGTTAVTYVFVDPSNNAATITFLVTILSENIGVDSDTHPPVILNCPSDVTAEAEAGVDSTAVSWTVPSATDNSGRVPTQTSTHNPGQSIGLGTTRVTYTFADAYGNLATCSFTVTVVSPSVITDTTPPVISNCPSDLFVEAAVGTSSAPANWIVPAATDNSDISPTRTSSRSPGQAFGLGTTLVIYTFTDANGNTAICNFAVTVQSPEISTDSTPPVIFNCPSDVTIQAAAAEGGATVNWNEPLATDNSGLTPTRTSSRNPGQVFVLGTTPVIYIFTDANGNSAACNFVVTVQSPGIATDTNPPVISKCPSDVTTQAASGESSATAKWNAPSATDDSGLAPARTSTHRSGQSFNLGTTQITYIFTDVSGNSASCGFAVTVLASDLSDTTAPVIFNCPSNLSSKAADGEMRKVVTWTIPTATDNVGISDSYISHNSGALFKVGTTDVMYSFLDDAGNEAECRFTVTVEAAVADNPCNSNPCKHTMSCYYTTTRYLCLPKRRRRRNVAYIETSTVCQCKNGGSCISESNGVQCECPARFSGILCEDPKPYDASTFDPMYADYILSMAIMLIISVIILCIMVLSVFRITRTTYASSKNKDGNTIID